MMTLQNDFFEFLNDTDIHYSTRAYFAQHASHPDFAGALREMFSDTNFRRVARLNPTVRSAETLMEAYTEDGSRFRADTLHYMMRDEVHTEFVVSECEKHLRDRFEQPKIVNVMCRLGRTELITTVLDDMREKDVETFDFGMIRAEPALWVGVLALHENYDFTADDFRLFAKYSWAVVLSCLGCQTIASRNLPEKSFGSYNAKMPHLLATMCAPVYRSKLDNVSEMSLKAYTELLPTGFVSEEFEASLTLDSILQSAEPEKKSGGILPRPNRTVDYVLDILEARPEIEKPDLLEVLEQFTEPQIMRVAKLYPRKYVSQKLAAGFPGPGYRFVNAAICFGENELQERAIEEFDDATSTVLANALMAQADERSYEIFRRLGLTWDEKKWAGTPWPDYQFVLEHADGATLVKTLVELDDDTRIKTVDTLLRTPKRFQEMFLSAIKHNIEFSSDVLDEWASDEDIRPRFFAKCIQNDVTFEDVNVWERVLDWWVPTQSYDKPIVDIDEQELIAIANR